jgi:hypothetical protein
MEAARSLRATRGCSAWVENPLLFKCILYGIEPSLAVMGKRFSAIHIY